MRSIFLILMAFSLLLSCGRTAANHEKKVDNSVELTQLKADSNFINPALKEVVSNYIKDVDGNFFDKEWLYYSLFFFTDKEKMYFTIWTFTTYPNLPLSEEYKGLKYKHSLSLISERKTVFIYPEDQDLKGLFVFTDRAVNDAKIENEKLYEGAIYDGDWYFKTFEMAEANGQWSFNKVEKANANFLHSQPPNKYLH